MSTRASVSSILKVSVAYSLADSFYLSLKSVFPPGDVEYVVFFLCVSFLFSVPSIVPVLDFVIVLVLVNKINLRSTGYGSVFGIDLAVLVTVFALFFFFIKFTGSFKSGFVLFNNRVLRRVVVFSVAVVVNMIREAIGETFLYTVFFFWFVVLIVAAEFVNHFHVFRSDVPVSIQFSILFLYMYIVNLVFFYVATHGVFYVVLCVLALFVTFLHLSETSLEIIKPVLVWRTSLNILETVREQRVDLELVVAIIFSLFVISCVLGIKGHVREFIVHVLVQSVVLYVLRNEIVGLSQTLRIFYLILVSVTLDVVL
jgi:hypothetical protein